MSTFIVAVETHRNKSIGSLIRCASAFGASLVAIVGSPKYSTHGAHGAQNHIQVMHFFYWSDLVNYVKEKGFKVCSISPKFLTSIGETKSTSHSVDTYDFSQSTCFIVGERDGLTDEQCSVCDNLLHIEVPNMAFEHLVNYETKIALCFQTFAMQNQFKIREFKEEKHVLAQNEYIKVKFVKHARHALKAESTSACGNSGASNQYPGFETTNTRQTHQQDNQDTQDINQDCDRQVIEEDFSIFNLYD